MYNECIIYNVKYEIDKHTCIEHVFLGFHRGTIGCIICTHVHSQSFKSHHLIVLKSRDHLHISLAHEGEQQKQLHSKGLIHMYMKFIMYASMITNYKKIMWFLVIYTWFYVMTWDENEVEVEILIGFNVLRKYNEQAIDGLEVHEDSCSFDLT